MIVVLDTTPLGILVHPRNPPNAARCRQWISNLLAQSNRIIVPEISDYEVRRELELRKNLQSLNILDNFQSRLEYLPLTTVAMRRAVRLWAQARQLGIQTAGNQSLDAEVILAAQALECDPSAVVATSNVAHLARFVKAEEWHKITP